MLFHTHILGCIFFPGLMLWSQSCGGVGGWACPALPSLAQNYPVLVRPPPLLLFLCLWKLPPMSILQTRPWLMELLSPDLSCRGGVQSVFPRGFNGASRTVWVRAPSWRGPADPTSASSVPCFPCPLVQLSVCLVFWWTLRTPHRRHSGEG